MIRSRSPNSTRVCDGCQTSYTSNQPRQRFCSKACRKRTWDREHDLYSGAQRRKAGGAPRRRVIGLDGEGLEHPARYVVLLASDGSGMVNADGLTTDACLTYLVSLPATSLKWGFSFSYDVNMILGSWPRRVLCSLWESISEPGGSCTVTYGRWRVRWIPGKQFHVDDLDSGQSCTVWDVWPFVQQSFVEWLAADPDCDDATVEAIRAMKVRRDTFADADLPAMETYCRSEVDLLAAGVRRMLDLFADADLTPRSYYGAGSLAAMLLRRHKVKDYLAPEPTRYRAAVAEAYYGGRFENAFVGWQDDAWALDINSAYPAAAARLPCLVHTEWVRVMAEPATTNALCRVEWNLGVRHHRFGPFPVSLPDGSLMYPTTGSGWYWSVEVYQAQRVWPGTIVVSESIELRTACEHRPFHFIEGMYAERQQLRAAGDPREKVYKLAMNAVYGKLAQRVGTAPHHSLAWAGMITATCRAQLLDAMGADPDNIRMIATDGLVVRVPPPLPYGDGLGEWSIKPMSDLLAIQPGLYFHTDAEGEAVVRSRGFGKSDLRFEDAARLMPRGVTPAPLTVLFSHLPTTIRRFNGLGTTVRRDSWAEWRTWGEYDTRITLNPWPRRAQFVTTPNGLETFAPAAIPERLPARHDSAEWRARTLEGTANMDGT